MSIFSARPRRTGRRQAHGRADRAWFERPNWRLSAPFPLWYNALRYVRGRRRWQAI